MNFKEAFEKMKNGNKVKLPSWGGYWAWENETIMMHTKGGDVVNLLGTEQPEYTFANIASEDFVIADQENTPVMGGVAQFGFADAIRYLKRGSRLTRNGWNGKGLSVVYQKGYPDGIQCNKQTAEAWGMKEGELFKCEPYLQISTTDGSHAMWVPSIRDVLAEDWQFIE